MRRLFALTAIALALCGLLQPVAGQSLLLMDDDEPVYLLRDRFLVDLAAGAVNATLSDNGVAREVTDTAETKILITGGELNITGNAAWDQEVVQYPTAITRLAGVVLRMDFTHNNQLCNFGFKTSPTAASGGYDNVGFQRIVAGSILTARKTSTGTSPTLWTATNNATFTLFVVLRNTGRYVLIKAAGVTRLVHMDEWSSASPLYVGINANSNTLSKFDNIRIPEAKYYTLTALASDSFNRDNGVLGTTDGAGHAEANSGSGRAWAASVGAWAVSTNAAACSSLDDGIGIATVDPGVQGIFVRADMTRSGGSFGLVFCYTDAQNYAYVYHDGTNQTIRQVVAGVDSQVTAPAAATYAAGGKYQVLVYDQTVRVHYNEITLMTGSINAALTGTKVGFYTTDTGNVFDNFVVFPASGYADLEQY